jgi:hypothetical protein
MRGIRHEIREGKRFGKLTVLCPIRSKFSKYRDLLFECACDCGRAKAVVRSSDLVKAKITACRLCRDESTREHRLTLSRVNPTVDYSKPIPASTYAQFRAPGKDGPEKVHVPDLNDLRQQQEAEKQEAAKRRYNRAMEWRAFFEVFRYTTNPDTGRRYTAAEIQQLYKKW